ncbi:SDR family NAD(P)-dependent oxidoreductase [Pseudoalteromonas sp. SMS1]|uniref:SDR family NAD(P)-dependent oxidoreductase n=1 Tax=Pseudoalteromonas sp. SMS1 TaxID=2908894 RepID=UPI001F2C90F7|nr:SDR family NAD(P)-dependent oxidoreductase [Pseudoalteromonas sp. SMS1]MCF2858519.1 SDR family NAD(P)-dependent oxidoreductase [Pseudoalteromonas sp. SMS1]
MKKTILITGSTDGIGLATAVTLLENGHRVLLHGRNQSKLDKVSDALRAQFGQRAVFSYCADLSSAKAVYMLAKAVRDEHPHLDVLINNAGVFNLEQPRSVDNLDVRFMVNTIAPFILTQELLICLTPHGRVVNLSSAAQAPFNADELSALSTLSDSAVYAKSKLALTMWSQSLGEKYKETGPMIVAVNPKSFLASKMVHEAYGMQGGNLQQGADIVVSAALCASFSDAGGRYFDNDIGRFTTPHNAASDTARMDELIAVLNALFTKLREQSHSQ